MLLFSNDYNHGDGNNNGNGNIRYHNDMSLTPIDTA